VISVEMDSELRAAYEGLEKDIKEALQAHKGNQSVISAGMNALLLYPDRPFRLGDLIGHTHDEATGRREPFLISSSPDLDEEVVYAKERRLLAEIKAELAQGRRCQVYAVYTQKRDVTRRWRDLLAREGIRVELLTTEVPPEAREAWYERQLRNGMQVCICHPKLVQTGLDYVEYGVRSKIALFETSSQVTALARLRVLWITAASRITCQPFRARAALRTSGATSSIWPRGNEKAPSSISSANESRDLRSPWRTTGEYASQANASSLRWENSTSTNLSWPRRRCNRVRRALFAARL
jgi:hypothetical protein